MIDLYLKNHIEQLMVFGERFFLVAVVSQSARGRLRMGAESVSRHGSIIAAAGRSGGKRRSAPSGEEREGG
jgi:hypothetical protein